ncbi:MAG: DUF4430 domain-containing protein [Dehalococcoidia bacterium]|nr:DUF4430 domain-containing protein [Dehalococcoidia bacterium]
MKRSSLAKLGVVSLIIAFLFVIALCGCQPRPLDRIAVKVIATQNFGNELVLDESVRVSDGANALDALEQVATVETKYGGGFVEAINGIRSQYSRSKVKKDWFFYVNGMSAKVGGLSYKLCDGDVEHWDFHDWSLHAFAPAIIGNFPQPFLSGYQGKVLPTVVVYDKALQDIAQDLISKLEYLGVENVYMAGPESSAYSKEHSNLILLGTEDFDLISELNGNRKLGFYIHFEEGKVVVYDSQGNKARHESECGLIQATQNPWNPRGISACENVVWMVSGTNESQVQNAIAILASHHEEFHYACAAVIVGDEVIKVPQ